MRPTSLGSARAGMVAASEVFAGHLLETTLRFASLEQGPLRGEGRGTWTGIVVSEPGLNYYVLAGTRLVGECSDPYPELAILYSLCSHFSSFSFCVDVIITHQMSFILLLFGSRRCHSVQSTKM